MMTAKKSFRQIRYEEKKEAMVRAAVKAFGGSKGFHGATIEQIAAELKMTKTSLYYYFSSKEELLHEVHTLPIKEILEKIDEVRKSKDPPETKFKNAVREHLRVLAENYEGCFLLQQEFELSEEHRAEVIALRDEFQKKFLGILRECVKAKVFAFKNEKIAAYCMLGAINWFLRWYSSTGKLDVDEIADQFIDFFLYGSLEKNREVSQLPV